MEVSSSWYKNEESDLVWWKDTPDTTGEWVFSFDRENPHWAEFFVDSIELCAKTKGVKP
ncbi:MAG: hypothetical protein NC489_33650 [Ruminococcus flavefaciens]|nr:hypothetical protein [Ruminococcus flavefaciens]